MNSYWKNREHVLLMVAWGIVYAAVPFYMWYADMMGDFMFDWGRVFGAWRLTTAFFILYVVHHFVLVPKFFLQKKYVAYVAMLCVCMATFTAHLICHEPGPRPRHMDMPRHEVPEEPWRSEHFRGERTMKPHAPKGMLTPPDVARLVIAFMMIGVDLGIIAWYNSQRLQKRLLLLEQQNLKQELEHLRYQINPHFFMNTLNNIHVLVDIDQERAKRAIIELSGLMRHSLYNGSESLTLLQNEIDFLRQYISLMQLRFGNRVTMTADLPDAPSRDIMIPPLLFATFVENAFKHGISYQTPSFINISLSVDTTDHSIHFLCINSRNADSGNTKDGYHGIGLVNVRKRLDLQYGEDYTLDLDVSNPQRFVVTLILPTTKHNPT